MQDGLDSLLKLDSHPRGCRVIVNGAYVPQSPDDLSKAPAHDAMSRRTTEDSDMVRLAVVSLYCHKPVEDSVMADSKGCKDGQSSKYSSRTSWSCSCRRGEDYMGQMVEGRHS